MSKRRQPPSPAVESPLAAVTSKPAPGKRQDQRPSPAAQRAAAAAEVQGNRHPRVRRARRSKTAVGTSAKVSDRVQDRRLAAAVDARRQKKKELDSSPPGSGAVRATPGRHKRRTGRRNVQVLVDRVKSSRVCEAGALDQEEDDKLRAGVSVVGPKIGRISDEFLGSMRSDVHACTAGRKCCGWSVKGA